MNPTIYKAIRERRLIEFVYDGGTRVVEPHCYGISTAGNEVLRGYQVAGYSESGQPEGWKLFLVSRMSAVRLLDEVFPTNRPFYNPNDSAMTHIYCHV